MNILVIGAGMMGSATAYDLVHASPGNRVVLGDIDVERAQRVAAELGTQADPIRLDTTNYRETVVAMKRVDAAIGATSYNHNLLLTNAAIEAGIHFFDLGGNMDVVYRQMALDSKAESAGVLIMPNCGLAPGLACVLGALGAKQLDIVEEIHLRVGGLPQQPIPPLNYQLVFSVEGLINEYLEPAEVILDGREETVASMADLETLEFPHPFGTMEAFNTSGGISTLAKMFKHARSVDYKTIRYPGHCDKFKTLLDLGFASSEPFMAGNTVMTTREFFQNLLKRKLSTAGPDVTLMRVTVRGRVGKSTAALAYEMIDYYDTNARMASMARTTAFPTSIIAQMTVNGQISGRGVQPPESAISDMESGVLLTELRKRNIDIRENWF